MKRYLFSGFWLLATGYFVVFALGCGNPSQAKSTENAQIPVHNVALPAETVTAPEDENPFKPFYVFSDKGSSANHYIPSGFMPDGKCLVLSEAWSENCHSGKSCVRVEYDVACSREGPKWAGIYWLNPANNWGQRKGGFNLTGARQLTFWARGEKGSEQIQEFTVGGIMGNYPDTDIATMGPVILSSEWRRYSVDLRGKDLSYISGGLAWSTTAESNPEGCIFYLDDIRFE